MRSSPSGIWTRSMEVSNNFRLFSYLHSFLYVRCTSFLFHGCPSPSKSVFLLTVFASCHHWALSPQFLSTSFLCFFCEFWYFWHSFQSILESVSWFYWKCSLYFCFTFFLGWFSGGRENWIYAIMVVSEVPMKYYYFCKSKYKSMKLIFSNSQYSF